MNRPLSIGPLRGDTIYIASSGHRLAIGCWIWDQPQDSPSIIGVDVGDSRYKCRVPRRRFYVTVTRWNSDRTARREETFELFEYGRFS